MPQKLSPEIINAAIAGFESQKTHIDSQIAELRSMLDGGKGTADASDNGQPQKKRKKFSAAARRNMKEAQRARWATSQGTSEATPVATARPNRKMSAAGRKAISEATKKRWALKRAAAKKVA